MHNEAIVEFARNVSYYKDPSIQCRGHWKVLNYGHFTKSSIFGNEHISVT